VTLKTQMQADASDVFLQTDDFAESITYTPLDDSDDDVTISAVVNRDPYQVEFVADGTGRLKEAVLMISAQATEGIVAPNLKDTVTFDSVKWAVVDIQGDGVGAMWQLRVRRFEDEDKHRENQYIRRGGR
jgi:hypothetical protein